MKDAAAPLGLLNFHRLLGLRSEGNRESSSQTLDSWSRRNVVGERSRVHTFRKAGRRQALFLSDQKRRLSQPNSLPKHLAIVLLPETARPHHDHDLRRMQKMTSRNEKDGMGMYRIMMGMEISGDHGREHAHHQ
jgi:hypothetical protein